MTDRLTLPVEPAQQALDAGERSDEHRRLESAAEQFESLFIQLWVRQMRDAQLTEGFFGSGAGSSVYEGMFEQHLAEQIGESSPLGIKEMLLRSWTGGEEAPSGAELNRRIDDLRARETWENLLEGTEIGPNSAKSARKPAEDPEARTPSSSGGSDR